jgi:hypothetical protein
VRPATAGSSSDAEGLASKSSGARVPAAGEEDLYRHLGLPYVPPELREGSGEVEAAEAGRLPDDLVTAGDLRGLIHCHTVYSDGKHTIAEMARAADAMGMRYLTITDHSPTAFYARGLDVDRLHAQWEEIARVQENGVGPASCGAPSPTSWPTAAWTIRMPSSSNSTSSLPASTRATAWTPIA